jgi:DNA-binding MarR family transcriptional regulator
MASAGLSGLIVELASCQARLLTPALKQAGLTWASFSLMAVVAGSDEIAQSELAQELGLAPATLSESVAEHVRLGLLRQVTSPSDKRVKMISVTAEGTRKLREVLPAIHWIDSLYDEPLGPAGAEQMAKNLEAIAQRLRLALSQSEPPMPNDNR